MKNIIDVIVAELPLTIEGLTGIKPSIKLIDSEYTNITIHISTPTLISHALSSYDQILIETPIGFSKYMVDMMLGGDGNTESLSQDDTVSGTHEIFANMFGAANKTVEGSDKDLRYFTMIDTNYISESEEIDLSNWERIYTFRCIIDNTSFIFRVVTKSVGETEIKCNSDCGEGSYQPSLIDDVVVKVKVLVGSKLVTLEELQNLKDNSIIELNQLVNEPLKLFVNNVPYAEGECVVVDGMFGIQITKLYTQEDVYHV